jgi:transposase
MLPVSNDTVLRVVRARACPRTEPLNVVGIDDWAFRRNHSYGTIVCDLERRRIVTLLPDREMATFEAWLAGHPDITVLSRDRGGGYGEAASKVLPSAIQVADRWHLMENASSAFLSAVRKSMRPIRAAIGATTINPELLTCAERLQYEGYLRREDTSLRRAFSPTFPAGGMVFFIPWRVVAEESGAAHFGFGGAMLLDLLGPSSDAIGALHRRPEPEYH